MIDSRGQTKITSYGSAADPNPVPRLSRDPQAPALSSRPWFFSLLPSADVKRTEISLNDAQGRVTGFIRFITGRPLSAKDVTTAADASQEHLAAAKASTVEEVKKRISSSADINRVDDRGMSDIVHAAHRGDLDMIKARVEAGFLINMENKDGKNALMLASENGHTEIVDYLLTLGADFTKADRTGCTALVLAARAGKTAVIQSFINAGVDIDAPVNNGSTPFMFAAENGHVEFVKELIAKGADVNKTNIETKMTALMYAVKKGQTEVVKLLLEKGARADVKSAAGWLALELASIYGHAAVVELLFLNIKSKNARNKAARNALLLAACHGHAAVIELLLEKKISVNTKDVRGRTGLMLAARHGHTAVVELLLKHAASVDEEAKQGGNALIFAAEHGHYAIITSLIESGANQYKALLTVLKYNRPLITKLIVRAWLNSKKNKFDVLTAINCCAHQAATKFPTGTRVSLSALDALAEGGLTLTTESLATLKTVFALAPKVEEHIKKLYVDGHISREGKIGNAYFSGNHGVVDNLIDAPYKTLFNPLGLVPYSATEEFNPDPRLFKPEHITRDNGEYLHAVGTLGDKATNIYSSWDRDGMLSRGWRSKVTTLVRNARSEAAEATRQISALMTGTGQGHTLINEIGLPVSPSNIRLKDTLFAFELERNEGLNQIIEPPVASLFDKLMAWAKGWREQTVKAQAAAILASNKAYLRLKLNMPALVEAKTIEINVRTGHLTKAEAAAKLDELLSKTEQTYLEPPPGITSELAYHWFISEVGEVYETLKTMRDQFKEASPAVPA